MLAYNKEGKLCLEDADGPVELDFSTLVRDFLMRHFYRHFTVYIRMNRATAYSVKGVSVWLKGNTRRRLLLR